MKYFILTLFFTFLSPAAHSAEIGKTADEIINEADTVRNPDTPFSIVVSLVEYRGGKKENAMALNVYSKENAASGQYRTLALFLNPPKDKGKVMLKNGTELWFYDPVSKSSVRISPQQRLMGQASNGDVMTVNMHKDYKAELAGEETITDSAKTKVLCYKLNLTSRGDSNYYRVEYWVAKADSRPLKGKFYSDSDRLLKIVYFGGYKTELGRERPTEAIVIDGIDPKLVTKMLFTNYTERKIPEEWFQKEYLQRFKGD
ncbi:MAG: outer membrane lipoprotein-sorting protein [Elusimicrobiota bacterium]